MIRLSPLRDRNHGGRMGWFDETFGGEWKKRSVLYVLEHGRWT